jgi:hypothetical protein
MITITEIRDGAYVFTGTLGSLLMKYPDETTFIGEVGFGPRDALYIISYKSVALARDPDQVWDLLDCSVSVREFVDVDITIKRRA